MDHLSRALLLCLALAAPAAAETRPLGQYGSWEVFGGTADDGTPVCGVSTQFRDGRYLGVKYFRGRQAFTVQAIAPGWKLAAGTRLQISLQFDRLSPWTGTATGNPRASQPGGVVEFTVPFARLDTFLREFRGAYTGFLSFPGGFDQPWTLNLTGSDAASRSMDGCIKAMAAATPPARPAPPAAAPTAPSFKTPAQAPEPPAQGGGSKF